VPANGALRGRRLCAPAERGIVARTTRSLLACGLALTVLACGSSAGWVDGGRDRADAAAGSVDHVPPDTLSSDHAAGDTPSHEVSDPIDWDAALECDAMNCAAGDLCVRWQGVVDGAPTMSTCYRVPDDCVAYPNCDCIKAFVLQCSSQCRSEGPRRFTCGEGI
jgi:hypothetical protein